MAKIYDPNSLTDRLESLGMDNSLSSRANLAVTKGLVSNANEYFTLASQGKNAEINTKLLQGLGETPAPTQEAQTGGTVTPSPQAPVYRTPQNPSEPISSNDLGRSFNLPEPGSFTNTTKTVSLNDRISEVAKMNLTDSTQKAIDELKSRMQSDVVAKKEKVAGEVDTYKAELDKIVNTTETETALRTVYDEFKIKDNLRLYSDIQTKIVDAQQALNMGLVYEKDRPARMRFISGAESTLQKQGLATIGALQGTAAVIKGNIDLAKSYADSTVNAINADNEKSFKALTTLLDIAEKGFVQLSEEERKLANDRIDSIEAEAVRLQKNKDDVLEYMTKYPRAFLNGGVTLLNTKEEALQKMLPIMAADEKAKLDAELFTKYKTSSSGTTEAQSQVYKSQLLSAKNGGMPYSEAILAFADVLDPNYINLIYGQGKTATTGQDAILDSYYSQFLNSDGSVKAGYKVTVDPKNGRPIVEPVTQTGEGFWKNIGQAFGFVK